MVRYGRNAHRDGCQQQPGREVNEQRVAQAAEGLGKGGGRQPDRNPRIGYARASDPWRLSAGEEADQKLAHPLGFIVLHPVACVGEPDDPLEVRYVTRFGLGQLGAEVSVALPPDH